MTDGSNRGVSILQIKTLSTEHVWWNTIYILNTWWHWCRNAGYGLGTWLLMISGWHQVIALPDEWTPHPLHPHFHNPCSFLERTPSSLPSQFVWVWTPKIVWQMWWVPDSICRTSTFFVVKTRFIFSLIAFAQFFLCNAEDLIELKNGIQASGTVYSGQTVVYFYNLTNPCADLVIQSVSEFEVRVIGLDRR